MQETWGGTARFHVRRRLGAGASGAVYEVLDRKRDAIVALKVLSRAEPTHLYLFKHEFRELAGMHHPHLATLYELEEDAGRWFFTMELVEGDDFLTHVRGRAPAPPAASGVRTLTALEQSTQMLVAGGGAAVPSPGTRSFRGAMLDVDGLARLRPAMAQLAEGVAALHAARKLHRDLKPSNVRVETGGRVVLLDFGLVLSLRPDGSGETFHIAGTPTYMAPEQAGGIRVSEASDWYAVGVMLFQALTGTTPFQGVDCDALLYAKMCVDPPAPSHVAQGVPPDLDLLCKQLLSREPAARPPAEEVLARLGASKEGGAVSVQVPGADDALPFVGRQAELARLKAAYEATRRGRPAVVWLHGPSGIGKSRLCQAFVDDLVARDSDAVILTGRCYQQETVPFEGIDSVVDALSRFLVSLPEEDAREYLPRDVSHLGRLFPVLRQVAAIGEVPSRATIVDHVEQRRLAFGALRELLGRIAARRPLVMTIEDLQWGGEDSGALLAELLQPPDPPAMLVLGTAWEGEQGESPLLRRLMPELDRLGDVLHREDIALAALAPSDVRALAASIVGSPGDETLERIARESEGNPFFACALARGRDVADLSLEQVIGASVDRLTPAARALLAVVSVAGRPLDDGVALRAAATREDGAIAIAELRSTHLIRVHGDDSLEPYHDRVRTGMLARLDEAATAGLHLEIADALEASGDADPEQLVGHFVSAGASARAAPYAIEAARRAADALAFERASVLYRLALSLDAGTPERRVELEEHLAEALANAGRGTNAGKVYLEAARHAGGERAVELRRRAAEQLLMSGRIDEGREVLRSVLASVGLRFPRTHLGAIVSLVWHNLRLRLRGLAYRERREDDVPRELLRRIDACWTVVHGLAGASPLHSMAFVAQGATLALRAGEPSRIANFLTMHATLMGALAPGTMERELEVSRLAAAGVDSEYSRVFNEVARVAGLYFAGNVQEYVSGFGRVERLLRERCRGVAWELLTFQSIADFSRTFLGDWKLTARSVHTQVREAEQRGDLYGAATLAMALGWVRHLAADDPQAALHELDDYLGRWSSREMHYQHFYDCLTRAYVLQYMGEARRALDYVDHRWRALRRAGLLRVQVVHALLLATRISCLVWASYENPADRRSLLRRARRDVAAMQATRFKPAGSWALHLRGCVALAEGDRDGALAMLTEAGDRMRREGFRTGPISGDLLRGELLGGDEGRALVASAIAYFRDEGFRDPHRFARLFAPGRISRA
jgi:hypothetical protein